MMFDDENRIVEKAKSKRRNDLTGGILMGILSLAFLGFSIVYLYQSEVETARQFVALDEGAAVVVSVSADEVRSINDGQLVHLTGYADTDDILTDSKFGITDNALRMRRVVEMYQWQEYEKDESKKYRQVWSTELIDSRQFKKEAKHENWNEFLYSNEDTVAETVRVSAFHLSDVVVTQIDAIEYIDPHMSDGHPANVRIVDGLFYFGDNPNSPMIGDTRIWFEVVRPTEVSIVAKQIGDTLVEYQMENGGDSTLVEVGTHTADSMFSMARRDTFKSALFARAFLITFISVAMILALATTTFWARIASFIPHLTKFKDVFIVWLLLIFIFVSVVIGLAWIAFRPLIGISLVIAAVLSSYVLQRHLHRVPKSSYP